METARPNPESGKEVAKQMSRFSAGYWQGRVFRPTYTRDGQHAEVAEWYARMQHGGRRQAVPLKSNNREQAARNAANLYQKIRSKGWDQALKEFDPDRNSSPLNLATVGGYLKACEPLFGGRKVTWGTYCYSLRKIALEVSSERITDANKYDPFHKPWQEKANGVRLSVLNPASIQKWKKDFVALAGANPMAQLRARRSVNSFLLNARTLFGPRMMKRLANHGLPPPVNPFLGVELEASGSAKYISTIRAADLLRDARAELAESDPESWKVILLGLGAGLRRGEIDMLETSQLVEAESLIRITNTEHFKTKTDDSQGVVYVDAWLIPELKRHLDGDSAFVVEPGVMPSPKRVSKYYRCQEVLSRVTGWLRAHGVKAQKPLHALRKEFGSIVNAATDIHTASRQLRHSTIKTTAACYTDHRRRTASAVPIGAMVLAAPTKPKNEEPDPAKN